jgi:hypothetical protein
MSAPTPDEGVRDGLCSDCGAGPFLSVEFFDKHRRSEHADSWGPGARTGAARP